MDLSLAASKFNTLTVDGWDPTGGPGGLGTWVRGVSRGTLQVYDRFVSDRTFGVKKRIFSVGTRQGAGIPPQFGVIRLPDGKIYMVEYLDLDAAHDHAYSRVYVLHEATFRAELYEMVPGMLPNGMPGPVVPVLQATYWGDMDKFSSTPSEFDQVRRETEAIWLERGAVVTPSQYLVVNGAKYMPREITKHSDLTFLRVERLTA